MQAVGVRVCVSASVGVSASVSVGVNAGVSVSGEVGRSVSGEVGRSGSSAWAASRQRRPHPHGGWNTRAPLPSLPHPPPGSKILLHMLGKQLNIIAKTTKRQ